MSRYDVSRSLLLETIAGARRNPGGNLSLAIDRRAFLAGSGAFLASLGPAYAAEGLAVEKTGRGYAFLLGNRRWLIDPDMFGPEATAEYTWIDLKGAKRQGLPSAGGPDDQVALYHDIRLKNAFLPGFSLRADFHAQLYRGGGAWQITIGFADADWREIPMNFEAWCDTQTVPQTVYSARYKAGPIIVGNRNNRQNCIEPDQNTAILEVDSLFQICIRHPLEAGALSIAVKQFRFKAEALRVSVSKQPERAWPDNAVMPFANLKFENARFRGGTAPLGPIDNKKMQSHLEYETCDATLSGFRLRGTKPLINDALLHLRGKGTLVISGPGTGPIGTRVQLDRWTIVGRANGLAQITQFAGLIARRAHAIDGNSASIVIQGDGTKEQIELTFDKGCPDHIAFETRLLGAQVPVFGASTAALAFTKRAVRVVIGRADPDKSAPALARQDALFCVGDGKTQFDSKLDDATLRVTRSTDLFDLTYSFRRYRIELEGGIARLLKAPPKQLLAAGVDPNAGRSLLIVQFPRQYLLEQAFAEDSDGMPGCIPIPPGQPGYCRPTDPPRVALKNAKLAQTRIAEPTRIVFTDNSPEVSGGATLSIKYLTDWSHLATVVNKRALPRTATLTDQLAVAGIDKSTSRADARKTIVANTVAPNQEETAIEPLYRLIVSPDDSAKWVTPRLPPHPVAPLMWSAELDASRGTSVRALWARDMDLSFLDVEKDLTIPKADFLNSPSFVASVNGDDRRQLTAMMSIYGLAAVRRLALNSTTSTYTDDPNGMVFLPDTIYSALDDVTKAPIEPPGAPRLRQEGFVHSRPFETFGMRLSRGATIDAKWAGEPPAPWGDNGDTAKHKFFKSAFTIEKYIHQTMEGRDTFVEVTYKGFLFPIGHRAAFIKVTKREFWPENKKVDGPPVAYLVQRKYIVVRNPEKTFPAYSQPYGSRDFSPRTVTIKTTPTPELGDPEPIEYFEKHPLDNDAKDKCRPIPESVFWPQLPSSKADDRRDVIFEYQFDDGTKVKSPLLFVDNAAAHDGPTMKLIMEYYRQLPEADLLAIDPAANLDCFLRFAKLYERPQRYAEENKTGECTFKTSSWVLGARGLIGTDNGEYFAMDAFMEGRDQPPFYPIISKSHITADKVDRLTGVPNTAIEVAYDPGYVRNGFDPAANPSEIFLDVVRPDLQFDPAKNTGSTGGVAATNSLLVAFGRKSGLIGGTRGANPAPVFGACAVRTDHAAPACVPAPLPGPGLAPALVPGRFPVGALGAAPVGPAGGGASVPATRPAEPASKSPYSLTSALAGRFDPVEFFGGALKDAKLLGIVPLKDILRAVLMSAAPKLMERVNYNAADALGATGEQLQIVAVAGARKILPLIDRAVAEANQSLASLSPGQRVDLQTLYPAFTATLETLKATLAKVVATEATSDLSLPGNRTQDNIEMMFGLATEFVTDVEAVADELKRLARDPMPTVVAKTLADIQQHWKQLRELVEHPETMLRQLVDQLIGKDKLFELVCEKLIQTDLFETMFGYLDTGNAKYTDLESPLPRAVPPPVDSSASIENQRLQKQQHDTHKELLKRQCKAILNNPAAVLPAMQQALFYEVFAEPFVKMLSAAQRLLQSASGVVQWSRATLADRIAAILRRGVVNARAEGFPTYAWEIIADIETAVPDIIASQPLDQIVPKIEDAVKRSIQRQIGRLKDDLERWKKAATAEADQLKQQALDYAKNTLSDEAQRAYREYIAKALWYQKLADSYNDLITKYVRISEDAEELKTLTLEIRDAVKQEILSSIAALEAQAREAAKAGAAGIATRLLTVLSAALEMAARSAVSRQIAEAGKDISNVCSAAVPVATDGFNLVRYFAFDVVAEATEIRMRAKEVIDHLDTITRQLNNLDIPPEAPQDIRDVLTRLRASLTRSLQQIAGVLLEFEKLRPTLPKTPATADLAAFCARPAELLDFPARSVDLRRRAAQAVVDALTHVDEAIKALPHLTTAAATTPAPTSRVMLASSQLKSVKDTQNDLSASLASLAMVLGTLVVQFSPIHAFRQSLPAWTAIQAQTTALRNKIDPAATALVQAAQELEQTLQQFATTGESIATDAGKVKEPAQALALAQRIVDFLGTLDRRLAGLVLQTSLPNDFSAELLKQLAEATKWIADTLIPLHDAVEATLASVLEIVAPTTPNPYAPILNLIGGATITALRDAQKQVVADRTALKALQTTTTNPTELADRVNALRINWSIGKSGLVLALQAAKTIVDAITSGNFATLFNVTDLERRLRDEIKKLIPSRVTLTYDFDTELGDYPSGNPIFAMDKEYYASRPVDSKARNDIRNDLDLRTRINVDLLSGDRDVSAVGFIRPFRIHLLGSSVDLATIHFDGARFESRGGATNFTADVADVEIGTALAFLKAIQEFIAPSKGNGFYRNITFREIEVGYRFSKDLIVVGALQLQNIGFSVGAILPIDGRQAEFHFTFATREKPFLIAYPPYGGGGFIGMRANARGVIAFEIQLEFGLVGAIAIGPLTGTARVTAGIYLMLAEGGRHVLEGFVQAVGEGNIACFSLSILIQVKTAQQDGSMVGSSTYSVSFKVGFAEIRYGFTATYVTKGGDGAQAQASMENFASAPERANAAGKKRHRSGAAGKRVKRNVRTVSPAKHEAWNNYRQYCDI